MENLLDILNNPGNRRIWILNIKYCENDNMNDSVAKVRYTYDYTGATTPFSLEAIKEISKYNYKTFVQAYKSERKELLDADAQDMRIPAVWSFYKNVRKGDIMLYVSGSAIFGYYVVTGDVIIIDNEENSCSHSWNANYIPLKPCLFIERRFGSPFFKLIGDFRTEVISSLKKSIEQ